MADCGSLGGAVRSSATVPTCAGNHDSEIVVVDSRVQHEGRRKTRIRRQRSPMKTHDRQDRILVELRKRGNISLEELVEQLKMSPASIRRDLTKLQEQGLVRRTHGGPTLIDPLLSEPFRYDSLFQTRAQHRPAEKRRIGAAAAELIEEHETVGFTAGTTTTQGAGNIRH